MSMLDSSVRKNGHWRYILCSNANCAPGVLPCRFTKAATAAPNPYQPGSVSRHWPQLKPQGNGARVFFLLAALARSGARADVELGDLADRRGVEEVLGEPRGLIHQRAVSGHAGLRELPGRCQKGLGRRLG